MSGVRLALTSGKIEMLQKPGLLSLNCLVQKPKSNHAREFFCAMRRDWKPSADGEKERKNQNASFSPLEAVSQKSAGAMKTSPDSYKFFLKKRITKLQSSDPTKTKREFKRMPH